MKAVEAAEKVELVAVLGALRKGEDDGWPFACRSYVLPGDEKRTWLEGAECCCSSRPTNMESPDSRASCWTAGLGNGNMGLPSNSSQLRRDRMELAEWSW